MATRDTRKQSMKTVNEFLTEGTLGAFDISRPDLMIESEQAHGSSNRKT
jgi:hypothetical protein